MDRRNWTRNELIVAFNLYCKLPFGKIHYRNPQIIELANAIGRTSSAVAWKLVNFASFDPTLQKRNIKGARNAGKLDRIIFDEFYSNWAKLAYQSEILFSKLLKQKIPTEIEDLDDFIIKKGKVKESLVRIRVNQSFFRSTILASYNNACCVTGISITDVLIASHIIPWSKDEKNRLNPENGLCLNSFHDKAFDHGLITVDTEYNIRISKSVEKFKDNTNIQKFFYSFDSKQINLPNRFFPNKEFLKYHNERIFVK